MLSVIELFSEPYSGPGGYSIGWAVGGHGDSGTYRCPPEEMECFVSACPLVGMGQNW